jgi:hypothetical protein
MCLEERNCPDLIYNPVLDLAFGTDLWSSGAGAYSAPDAGVISWNNVADSLTAGHSTSTDAGGVGDSASPPPVAASGRVVYDSSADNATRP